MQDDENHVQMKHLHRETDNKSDRSCALYHQYPLSIMAAITRSMTDCFYDPE